MLRPENGRPDPTIFREDSLHMNALGYDRWERLVYDEIKVLLNYKDSEDQALAGRIGTTVVLPEPGGAVRIPIPGSSMARRTSSITASIGRSVSIDARLRAPGEFANRSGGPMCK